MSIPVTVPATVKFDANGNASATFGTPGVSYVWTGSITVPGAASTSVIPVTFKALKGGITPLATWYNDQPSGQIQVASGEILALTGAGLAPGTYTATFVGAQDVAGQAPAVWPQPTPAPPPSLPIALFNNQAGLGPIPANTARTLFLNAPVIVGTGVESTLIEQSGNPFQLGLIWNRAVGSPVAIDSNFDIAGDGTGLWGWTTPNRDSILTAVVRTGPNPCTIEGQILTGMPAVNLASLLDTANGVLVSASQVVAAGSGIAVALPPFIGPVMIYAQMAGGTISPTPQLDVAINSTDYLAAVSTEVGHLFASVLTAYGFIAIPPTPFFLPPRNNSLSINNRSSSNLGITYAVIAATPPGA